MAKDTFEKLLIHIWAELVAGLVIVTMGYFALNPNSGIGVGLSLLGCLSSVAILVYLFRDKILGTSPPEKQQPPSPTQQQPPPSPTQQPTQQMMSKSTFDDDDDEDKKLDGLKAHYASESLF